MTVAQDDSLEQSEAVASSPPQAPESAEPEKSKTERKPLGPAVHTTARIDPIELSYRLRAFENYPIAEMLRRADRAVYNQCLEEQAHARQFTERHIWPFVEQWDQVAAEEHGFVPWPAIDAGMEYGLLSLMVPANLGGRGVGAVAGAVHAEEIAAADAGVFVLFGAHELAMAGIAASLHPGPLFRIMGEIADGEKRGKAVLLALAYTEPTAGSDVEDGEDIARAKLASRWEQVPGGYRVNARKVFISNGSIARYSMVAAWGDPSRPNETAMGFLIPNDAPGYSVGRVERKMGQRLCPASEIICEDVFVPEENAWHLTDNARMIDTVLSITRGPVGAMSVGIARGCMERTLKYLAQKRVGGRWLFEEQWVQLLLAEIFGRIQAGRGLYMDAAFALEHWGFGKLQRATDTPLVSMVRKTRVFQRILNSGQASQQMAAAYSRAVSKEALQRCVSVSSTAKFMCSDMAVEVCGRAMDILGEDANDPQWGVEKCLRDAKLGQIFEGTNQLNRLHVTRGLLRRQ
ncbi:MAG: acyl-CoA/acyl-ACP dehydrogenase [Myxococcales bacterium]|nr:acyl-CoA/acyl-ACP dehydrogenase [Myxococcales bacterium]